MGMYNRFPIEFMMHKGRRMQEISAGFITSIATRIF